MANMFQAGIHKMNPGSLYEHLNNYDSDDEQSERIVFNKKPLVSKAATIFKFETWNGDPETVDDPFMMMPKGIKWSEWEDILDETRDTQTNVLQRYKNFGYTTYANKDEAEKNLPKWDNNNPFSWKALRYHEDNTVTIVNAAGPSISKKQQSSEDWNTVQKKKPRKDRPRRNAIVIKDIHKKCPVCKEIFIFTVDEQMFFMERSLRPRTLCKPCKDAKKAGYGMPNHNRKKRINLY